MKTYLSILFICCLTWVQAQLTITTNLREEGIFNETYKEWYISNTIEGLTVFTFNKELTSFRHSTNSISSVYSIDDWTFNDEEVLYEMIVTSDAGNEYDLLIDGINDFIIFFYYDDYGFYHMVRHTIQDSYFDE
jgi:hypothetical protein